MKLKPSIRNGYTLEVLFGHLIDGGLGSHLRGSETKLKSWAFEGKHKNTVGTE